MSTRKRRRFDARMSPLNTTTDQDIIAIQEKEKLPKPSSRDTLPRAQYENPWAE